MARIVSTGKKGIKNKDHVRKQKNSIHNKLKFVIFISILNFILTMFLVLDKYDLIPHIIAFFNGLGR